MTYADLCTAIAEDSRRMNRRGNFIGVLTTDEISAYWREHQEFATDAIYELMQKHSTHEWLWVTSDANASDQMDALRDALRDYASDAMAKDIELAATDEPRFTHEDCCAIEAESRTEGSL